RASRSDLAQMVDKSLMDAGFIILIIAASGAFGVALQATGIGPVIERAFVTQAAGSGTGSGLVFLFLGFGVASLIKIAQGSSTVAMIDGGDARGYAAGERWRSSLSHRICR